MLTAKEYRTENKKLMEEFEIKVREWLISRGEEELADKIPYFRDGVVCPEVWFDENNDFRPLIILKEVSVGKDNISDLDEFLAIWGNQKHFEFVENPFDDVRIGRFDTWTRIARLAKGLEEIHNGSEECDYYKYDLSYKEGELYSGDIEGYKIYKARTSNEIYENIINKIAVLEIKKIGGGRDVGTELSKATAYYTDHIEPFKDLICRQIELINPTVIICCGRENGGWSENILKEIKENTAERLWIDGYHPRSRGAFINNFYNGPLAKYKEYIKSK